MKGIEVYKTWDGLRSGDFALVRMWQSQEWQLKQINKIVKLPDGLYRVYDNYGLYYNFYKKYEAKSVQAAL